ncbi:hypothetical protein TWF481_009037 [Arthrobotrys musiformis]|uniref:Uncharacterized protein n=1 Tax=Arthrobotrys musiformis TaxID=47236 RepID=A0AAV9W4R9_9PEZI
MARQSNRKASATGPTKLPKFGKLDYEVYCRFKRAFAGWGGTTDHKASVRRVVERRRADDGDTELLVAKVGLRAVLQCLQKLLKAKAFCKSTELARIFPDLKWSAEPEAKSKVEEVTASASPVIGDGARSTLTSQTLPPGTTSSHAGTSLDPPPEGVKPSGVEEPARATRGRTGISKSGHESQQARAPRPSSVVGNWNMGLLEPVMAENRTLPAPLKEQDGNEATRASTIEPKHLSGAESRQLAEQAYSIAKETISAHLNCEEGANSITENLQPRTCKYGNELPATVLEMRFDAFFQIESLVANSGQIEPLALAQITSQCAQELEILGKYQHRENMGVLKAKALSGAMYWVEERKKELEEQQRRVLGWEETIHG